MKLGVVTLIFAYVTLWWTVLFAILPLGARSHAEAGLKTNDGGDPGAPVKPNLKRKAITTTWVTAIVWGVLVLIVETGAIGIPQIADH